MSPRTRNVLVASGAVVAAGLCFGLIAYFTGSGGERRLHPGLAYLPGNATVVAFADVQSIMHSEFRQRLREVMPTGTEKDRLLKETGIDLEADIDSVLAGVKGAGPADGSVVVFQGRFDQQQIGQHAAGRGARPEEYGGVAMLVGLAPSDDEAIHTDHVAAIAFLQADLIALGSVEGVRAAIDASATGTGVAANPDLMRAIHEVHGTGDVWLVGHGAYLANRIPAVSGQVRGHLEEIEWLSVRATVDRDVRGMLRAETRDEKAGQELRSVIAGLLVAGKAFGVQDPVLTEVLESLQVTGAGPVAELSFVFSGELLNRLSASAPAPLRPGSGR